MAAAKIKPAVSSLPSAKNRKFTSIQFKVTSLILLLSLFSFAGFAMLVFNSLSLQRISRELKIDFWIQGAGHKAKPHGYDGAVIIWGIRDTPPETPDQLEHHTMASRTPFTLHFDETERGRTVYVGLAWQNERGILGQWSEYKSAVIP
ncbi:MAG: hypothetical protein LBB81_11420 [Treponema sp.]|jgi:hypothetical protein|nr:hypothetical protein [Treponema sp.]